MLYDQAAALRGKPTPSGRRRRKSRRTLSNECWRRKEEKGMQAYRTDTGTAVASCGKRAAYDPDNRKAAANCRAQEAGVDDKLERMQHEAK